MWYSNFREAVSGYTDGDASSNEVIFLRSNVMEPVKICSEAATVDGLAAYN